MYSHGNILLSFRFLVSWSGEATCGAYGEKHFSEILDFNLAAVTGWNFAVIFLRQMANIFFLRKERCTLGI